MYSVHVEGWFAAAHALRNYKGSTEPLHGHNFRVRVVISGESVDDAGMLVDFVEVKSSLDEVLGRFEHTNLNEVAPFDEWSPSSENVARYIHSEMSTRLRAALQKAKASLVEVYVWETEASSAAYRP